MLWENKLHWQQNIFLENTIARQTGSPGTSGTRAIGNWIPAYSGTRPTLGPPRDRPVCRPSQCSTDELCQLFSRPIIPGNRCLSDSLVEAERLQLSTFLNDLPLPGKDQERPGINSYDNSNLAYTSMVPSSTRNVLQTASPPPPPPSQGHPYVSQSTATPLCSTRKLTTSGLDVSGKPSLQKEFQSKLLSYSAPTPGARELRALTIAPGHSGVAGVIREKLIHFAPLWPL